MKKKNKTHPVDESRVAVDLKYMREFRAEMNARFTSIELHIKSHDARFDQIESRFAEIDARFDRVDARFAEMEARFSAIDARFAAIDARFTEIDARFAAIDARFAEIDARFDRVEARFTEMEARFDKKFEQLMEAILSVKVLVEEQNLRNKQCYDGYFYVVEELHSIKRRIKPECLSES